MARNAPVVRADGKNGGKDLTVAIGRGIAVTGSTRTDDRGTSARIRILPDGRRELVIGIRDAQSFVDGAVLLQAFRAPGVKRRAARQAARAGLAARTAQVKERRTVIQAAASAYRKAHPYHAHRNNKAALVTHLHSLDSLQTLAASTIASDLTALGLK
ncbi:MAG: hypothetical protein AB7U83_23460 [Vicinamibacterales bacterium]